MEPAVVGVVEQGSAAATAGMQPGDRIVALDGKQNPTWQEVESKIFTNPGTSLTTTLNRDGRTIETRITPERQTQDGPAGPAEVGEAGFCPVIPVVIKKVWKGFPGDAAGLQPGDEIVAVKGIQLKSACRPIQEVIKSIPEVSFPLTILRQGEKRDVEVGTTLDDGQKRIGMDIPYPMVQVKHRLGEAFQQSIAMNQEQATLMFQVIGKLFRREASLNQLAGPIGIVRVSGQAYELGAGALIRLMAFISLNLGVLNTLPIPILDGGVMLLILVESIIRRDLSLRVKERIVQVGFVFLLVLTVLVLYNDVMKLMPPGQHAP
jgi:regulator of sigma E protease